MQRQGRVLSPERCSPRARSGPGPPSSPAIAEPWESSRRSPFLIEEVSLRRLGLIALTAFLAGCAAGPVVQTVVPARTTQVVVQTQGVAQPARPMADLTRYISREDYPAAALSARQQGTTAVRLTIGPDGRVTGCAVTASAGSAHLDSATCRLLRSHARFSPARDAAGNPRESMVETAFTWTLPR